MKGLSKTTIGLGVYIVISAAFMLQVRNWLFKIFGSFAVVTCFKGIFILIFAVTVVTAFRKHLGLYKICAISEIFALGYLLILAQEFFTEKTHVLTYGLLGYLTLNDLIDTKIRLQFKSVAQAAIFVTFVSALDEIFQGILPYRFAELKDFITNIMSGVLGIATRKILLYSTEKGRYNFNE